jgi:Flagellar P-ring protein
MRFHRSLSNCILLAALLCAGCQSLDLEFELPGMLNPDNRRKARVSGAIRGEKGHSRLLGDYISIGGDTVRMVQGVGMVVGLDGTGEDPPATPQRKLLLEEMRRRKIEDPESLLRSPNTALVVVTAYIPPLIRKGDTLDVEIKLTEGSQTTSLRGGHLMPCFLREYAYLADGGGLKEGRELAISHGAIMVRGDENDTAGLVLGVIPGGGKYTGINRDLGISLREDYKGAKMTTRIADRIGQRFAGYDHGGIKRPLAKAKTDQSIELIVAERYRDNYPRYLQAIRAIRLTETSVDHHLRLQELGSAVQRGDSSAQAALELEAIGPEAIPILKDGLKADEFEARFRAAEALAYLNDASGVTVLKEAADKEPAFRVFALAALSTLNDGDAVIAMRELMQHESIETRYGAFRALSIASPNDPSIIQHKYDSGFAVHLVETTQEPAIHVTRRRKSEVVLFGVDQQFTAPLVMRAGHDVIVQCPDNGNRVKLTLILPGQPTRELYSSLRVADVIAAAVELGVEYPAIVEMLEQAHKQRNLDGMLAFDQLPQPGRSFQRPDMVEGPATEMIGSSALMPNLFDIDPSGLEVEAEMEKAPEGKTANPEEMETAEGMNGVSFGVQ